MGHRILELYSGIGGMHCAWNESGLLGDIVTAIDINTVANEVYKHNFPTTELITKNIQSLTPKQIERLKPNTILMSPPCQPFTRNGKFLDKNDPRTDSFLYILSILKDLCSVEYILLENVKGFECSEVRDIFIEKLKECEFHYQECLLCPSTVGVPNSRLRYYCIAKRKHLPWIIPTSENILTSLPKDYGPAPALENIIEENVCDNYLIPDNMLKRGNVFDVCYKESRRSCCFTKAYSHYMDGTGSVFTNMSPEKVNNCFQIAKTHTPGSNEYVELLKPLQLRYFTPREILLIMNFPPSYSFPSHITTKQCYRLLGNSVNVKVISELLKFLYS